MSLEAEHLAATYLVKNHLRDQYNAHRTSIDKYATPELTYYADVLYQMTVQASKHVLIYEGADAFRYYVHTNTTDWQKDS